MGSAIGADEIRILGKTGRRAVQLARRLSRRAAKWIPGRGGLGFLELSNKLAVYGAFAEGACRQGIRQASLKQRVARARRAGRSSVWRIEGLGYALAESRRRTGREAAGGLLLDPPVDRSALLPLHMGMGILFALAGFRARREGLALERMLVWILRMGRINSRPGYLRASFEALGLAAPLRMPGGILDISRWLSAHEPSLDGYFWHGVGRGLYFSRYLAWPGHSLRMRRLRRIVEETPRLGNRINLAAGYAMALALANLREPEVIDAFLRRRRQSLRLDQPLISGFSSAALVWRQCTKPPDQLAELLGYRPPDGNKDAAQDWHGLVADPIRKAIQRYEPALSETSPSPFLRYRSPSSLAKALRPRRPF